MTTEDRTAKAAASERLTDRLSRYIDGEIDAAESRAICDQFEIDGEARRRLAALLAVDSDTRVRFDAMLDAPTPERLTQTVTQGFRRRRGLRPGRDSLRWVSLIAASLVLLVGGSFVLTEWVDHRAQLLIAQERNAMREVLSQTVQQALETAESGHSVRAATFNSAFPDLSVTPTRTFRSKSGHFCREFEELVPSGDVILPRKSVACRIGEGVWKRVTTTIEGDVDI